MELPTAELSPEAQGLRTSVRTFLEHERQAGTFRPGVDSWLSGFSPEFSRKLGQNGWLGMTWPRKYGGHERSFVERFVVIEELLAAGAPVGAHWIADRQSGGAVLRYGTDEQCQRLLPPIAAGDSYWAIGMSEPDSGSDLASVRTRATRVPDGWQVSGTKIWTSGAHVCHYMIALCRTSSVEDDRHAGLSQFIVDLSSSGVTIRPIPILTGAHHFNEVHLDDVFVPDEMVLGKIGNGWDQVMSELTYERSGPERFLSTMQLLTAFVRIAGDGADARTAATVGSLVAQLWSIRQMSIRVAAAIDDGRVPGTEAALVKDLGTRLEQEVVESIRVAGLAAGADDAQFMELLVGSVLHAPGFTLRGGTNEILRDIVGRDLSR